MATNMKKRFTTFLIILFMLVGLSPATIHAESLDTPTGLKWGSPYIKTMAVWDWNTTDDYKDVARYKVECKKVGTDISTTVEIFPPSDGYNFVKFIQNNGGGEYVFSVQALATAPSGKTASEVAKLLQPQTFYVVSANWKTVDENDQEIDPDAGYGQIFISDETGGQQASIGPVVSTSGSTIKVNIKADIGYVVESITFDSEPADKAVDGNLTTFTLDKDYVINVVFKKDNSVANISVNFGSTHKDVAQEVKDYYDDNTESFNNISNVQVDDNGVMTFNYIKANVAEADVWEDVASLIGETYSDIENKLLEDDDEYIHVDGYSSCLGKSTIDKYASYDEWNDEYQAARDTSLDDQLQLNVLWLLPVSLVEFEVEPLLCNTEVSLQQSQDHYVQNPSVKVTATKDSEAEVHDDEVFVPVWFDEKPENFMDLFIAFFGGNKLFKGTATIDDDIYVIILIDNKFGYIVDKDKLNAKINGEELSSDEIMSSEEYTCLFKKIPVEHNWSSWYTIKEPTEDEDGLEERICLNDSSHKETRIIPASYTCGIELDTDYVEWTTYEGYKGLTDEGLDEDAIQKKITATSIGSDKVEFILAGFKDASSYEYFSVIVGGMSATVAPKEGLKPGIYKATLLIEDFDDRFLPIEVPISFKVMEKGVVYSNIEGNNLSWYKNSNKYAEFIFKRNIDDEKTFGEFTGILVDGEPLDSSNYTATAGSLIVNLKPAYLQ